jgi:hypothetical protein
VVGRHRTSAPSAGRTRERLSRRELEGLRTAEAPPDSTRTRDEARTHHTAQTNHTPAERTLPELQTRQRANAYRAGEKTPAPRPKRNGHELQAGSSRDSGSNGLAYRWIEGLRHQEHTFNKLRRHRDLGFFTLSSATKERPCHARPSAFADATGPEIVPTAPVTDGVRRTLRQPPA